uniref:CTLH/CRA C-terminal to LisH motif domain-containing protein n=1 Tax=Panagrolaimus sp. ES5 TaxID=591445 RepID=A0AC34GGF5_9BILA
EAELPIDSKEEKPSEDLKTVIELYRKREIVAVIEFLEASKYKKEQPECTNLLFDLHRQHIIFLLEQNKDIKIKKDEALAYSRNLQPFASDRVDEISHIMGAVFTYSDTWKSSSPDFKNPIWRFRYKNLFHPNNWLVVESNLAKLVSKINSPVEVLLTIGAKAMPSMLSIKNVLTRSPLISSEELPISVEIPNPVHSTFTCPILKVQATESNPPIR